MGRNAHKNNSLVPQGISVLKNISFDYLNDRRHLDGVLKLNVMA